MDKASKEFQRLKWEQLRKSVNGLINKYVGYIHISLTSPELTSPGLTSPHLDSEVDIAQPSPLTTLALPSTTRLILALG